MMLLLLTLLGCELPELPYLPGQEPPPPAGPKADVIRVWTRDTPEGTIFQVSVLSEDLGCQQYANWWEIVTDEGELVTRRTLAHSHVDEQAFARDSEPVKVDPNQELWVRAHMHPSGYVGQAMKGTVAGGFEEARPPSGFAAALAEAPPQPAPCLF